MKIIPDAIARKVARQGLLVSKHSPSILFGAGIVGMVGSTVLACRSTLKLDEVLESTQRDLFVAKRMEHEDYSESDRKRDIAIILARGTKDVAKLYAPALLLGAASIGCLTKSHHILNQRNLAVTAAYAAVDEAFKKYRGRVIEKYGEDEDRQLRYESEMVDVIDEKTGKTVLEARAAPGEHSMYSRYFDDHSSSWNRQPEYNFLFLSSQQNWFNDVLRSRGHLFLNEVYEGLGLDHTTAGSVVGWVMDRNKESGDNFVDFGLYDAKESIFEFVNGRDGSILLDFNVDGIIYDKINEHRRGTPHGNSR